METISQVHNNNVVVQTARNSASPLQAVIDQDKVLADLMQSAQSGCEGASSRLFAALRPVIGRMIRRRLGYATPSDQEDLLQEVLMSVHAARASYDPDRPFTPWPKAIVINRGIDFLRRQKRNAAAETLSDELAAELVDDTAGQAVVHHDAADALRKAIGSLPIGQRFAIELVKLRELSLKEAAAITGMSVSALKASVHRAVATLRVSLAPYQTA